MNEQKTTVNHCISLDYLEISCEYELPTFSNTNVKPFYLNKHTYIQLTDNTCKYFNSSGSLFINNCYIGDIRYNPKERSFIPSHTLHLKLSNHLLYTQYFRYYLEYINDVIGMKFNYILRLDIANDLVGHNVLQFMKTYENSSIITCKGKPKEMSKRLSGKKTQIIHFGSITSDRYIKIYNKSADLTDGNKEYIKEYWDKNGMDYSSGNVERLELTLQKKQAKLVDINLLHDIDYLASLCKNHFVNYFEFYRREKRCDKIKMINVTPINFDNYYGYKIDKYKYQPQITTRPAKQALKTLFFEILDIEDKIKRSNYNDCVDLNEILASINASIDHLLKENRLETFYDGKKKVWFYEYGKRIRTNNKNTDK